MTIQSDIQQPDAGSKVHLFILDASALGGSVHRFCSSVLESQSITWQDNIYSPMPVTATGFEIKGGGTLPTPTLTLSDAYGIFRALVRDYNDLIGATLTRYVTLRKYLDGQPQADPDAYFPPDVFTVAQKTKQEGAVLEWRLEASMDQQGLSLPRRTVLKDICDYVYRTWNSETIDFDYTYATCPYAGTLYFDVAGDVCAASSDVCGHRLADCILRYGKLPLPFHGFPGVSRVRN